MFKQLTLSRRLAGYRLHPRLSIPYSNGEGHSLKDSESVPPGSGKRRTGSIFLKLLGVTTLGVGGIAATCYLNNDVKEKLETSVPYFKETEDAILSALSTVGLQNITEGSSKPQELIKKNVPDILKQPQIVRPEIKSDQSGEVPIEKSLPSKTIVKPQKTDISISRKDIPTEKEKAAKVQDEKSKEIERMNKLIKEKQMEEERQKLNLELKRKGILDDISIQSMSLLGSVQNAISSQVNLETKIRQHTSQLKKALDDDGVQEELLESLWNAVSSANDAKIKAMSEAATSLSYANHVINALQSALDESKDDHVIASDEIYLNAQKKLIESKYDLSVAVENTKKAEAEASLVLIYKELIEKGKRQFMKEVECVKQYQGRLNKDGKLTEDDWNFLIAHAYRRVEQLQRRILQLELGQKDLLESAVNFQRASDDELAEQRLSNELQRQRQEFELEKQKWDAKARDAFDTELRESLARQAAAHSDHLVQVLRIQREEQNRQFELETRERILRERESFQAAIEKWINRVKGLESVVEGRAYLEQQGQLSQKLWLACQNFSDSIMAADDREETIPLKEKMLAVNEASGGDACLKQILAEVPPLAEERGVFSVDVLCHRFRRVKAVCKRVAMIDETGGTLAEFVLSWLQSIFIFERSHIYGPNDEIDQMDSFTLLSNADECIRNGDLETALKFMAQLKGLARVVASDWIAECRLTLEMQLIANTLIAFAGDRSARAILKAQS